MSHIHEKIDFVVTAFIIHKKKVLFIDHIKLHKWLPIGGHIELDEDPDEALFREIKEESGIDKSHLTLLSTKPSITSDEAKSLYTPHFMDIHTFNETHKHVSLNYFMISDTDKTILNSGEHQNIRWFSEEDLDKKEFNIIPLIKFYSKEAFKTVNI